MQRFSEAQFRQYEGLIEAAVYVLPSRYMVDTPWNGFAQSTVSRNLREALQALHANPTWITTISRKKFEQYFSVLEVAEEPGRVLVRIRSRGQRAAPTASVNCLNTLTFTRAVDPAIISTCIALCHTGLLAGIRLINTGMAPENVEHLTANTNVCVVKDNDDIVLL